jgi:hypothetical protein
MCSFVDIVLFFFPITVKPDIWRNLRGRSRIDKPEIHAILGKNARTNRMISNTDLT